MTGQAEYHAAHLAGLAFVLVLVLVAALVAAAEAASERRGHRRSFVCPDCGAESFNPNDVNYGYCGRCHAYTGRPAGLDVPPQELPA